MFARYPLALHLREDDFIAEKRTGGVQISCCYKRSSRWGVLTGAQHCDDHERCPAWLLEMELHIQPTFGRINYTAFSLAFDSESQLRNTDHQSRHGVLVTEYHKPITDEGPATQREVRRETTAQPELPTTLGTAKVGHVTHETKETVTDRWQFYAMRSSSSRAVDRHPRRIEWTLKESKSATEREKHLWQLAVVVRHDREPFLLSPDVSGQLRGFNRVWAFRPKLRALERRKVTPIRLEPEVELNEAALRLLSVSAKEPAATAADVAPLTTGLGHAFDQTQANLPELFSSVPGTRTAGVPTVPAAVPVTQPSAQLTMLPAPNVVALPASEPSMLPALEPMTVPSIASNVHTVTPSHAQF